MIKEHTPKGMCWWSPSTDSVTADYCIDSSMHGLKYVGQTRRHLVERIFWIIAFLTAVCIAAYFISLVWKQYKESPVIVSFEPLETAVDQIPFPAITICNVNNVQKKIAEEYMRLVESTFKNGDPEPTEENNEILRRLYYLNHICSTKSFTRDFGFNDDLIDPSLLNRTIEYFNTYKVSGLYGGTSAFLEKVAQSCEHMILLCYWGDQPEDCSNLFMPTETDNGFCCTFNMVPTSILLRFRNDSRDNEDVVTEWMAENLDPDEMILSSDEAKQTGSTMNKLPRRQLRSGRTSGLSVLLNPDLNNYFCTNADSVGFQLEAHFPLGYPQIAENGIAIPPSSEVFMNIRPMITTSDDKISAFPQKKRQCYFGGEFTLNFYTYYTLSNCIGECISNITFNKCQCVRYYQPRDNIRGLCGPYAFNCTEQVRKEIIRTGMRRNCNMCLPPCTEVVYNKETTVIPLRRDINLWKMNGGSYQWPTNVTEDELTILHIFFSEDSTYARIRTRLYDETQLLSNTGGILGLCLGFSGLSLLEIVYFLTLRAWCRSVRGRRVNAAIATTAVKMWKAISNSSTEENKDFYKENNSFATKEEFQTWAIAASKPPQELTLEITPSYKPQFWN